MVHRPVVSCRSWFGASVVAAVVVAGLLAAGCSAASSSGTGSANDQEFLSAVHTDAPDISTYRSDVQLVRLGHAVCDGFSAGASYVQLADRLALQEGSDPLPAGDLGAVISSAARALCPRYESQVT
jgi:hypothetical protein